MEQQENSQNGLIIFLGILLAGVIGFGVFFWFNKTHNDSVRLVRREIIQTVKDSQQKLEDIGAFNEKFSFAEKQKFDNLKKEIEHLEDTSMKEEDLAKLNSNKTQILIWEKNLTSQAKKVLDEK